MTRAAGYNADQEGDGDVVEGGGTGGALDGKGTVRTTRHWVAIDLEKDVIDALSTSLTSDFEQNEKHLNNV